LALSLVPSVNRNKAVIFFKFYKNDTLRLSILKGTLLTLLGILYLFFRQPRGLSLID